MDECNLIKNDFHKATNIHPDLNAIPLNTNISNEQKFRLNKINEIKDYFPAEIREENWYTKTLLNILLL